MNKKISKAEVAKMIDHTQLKAAATYSDIKKLCEEAKQYQFASVCINPCWVSTAEGLLRDSGVKICTVIGFPLGANTPRIKAEEAAHAVMQGADEVDMVINVGRAKAGDFDFVEEDIRTVVQAARDAAAKCIKQATVKVIIETCYLTDEEKVSACIAAKKAGADFVKTSTGFGTPGKDADGNPIPNGATVHDVELMRKTVDSTEPLSIRTSVKASGGIRDAKTALAMIEAGADRLGVSAGVAIVEGIEQ